MLTRQWAGSLWDHNLILLHGANYVFLLQSVYTDSGARRGFYFNGYRGAGA